MNDKYILNYILNGHTPVVEPDLMKWAQWFETADRHVVRDKVGDKEVSTVFLGLDYSFDYLGKAKPIFFETMIFNEKGEAEDDWRYCTWEEAEAGHKKIVEELKSKVEQS